ncbi:MAG TPA: cytoplasmic protein [Candidatus Obscuribacterales bacterium]
MFDREQLEDAYKGATSNKQSLAESKLCGCFFCLKIFSPNLIERYLAAEDTAICPFCQIDSVLPATNQTWVSPEFLAAMHKFWFEK